MTDFEHYMYIVPMKVKKICPQLAGDEDFLQECYLDFLEFTQKDKNFNAPEWHSRRATLAHGHIERHIKSALKKRGKKREIPSGLLIQDMRFCDIEKIVFRRDLRTILGDVLQTLTEREQDVIEGIFFYDRTYTDIGESHGVTKERVRQIERKALSKLAHPSRAKKYRDFYE